MTTFRITVETLDEDGEPVACTKTSCRMCSDRKQVRTLKVKDSNRPHITTNDWARWAGLEAEKATLALFEPKED